MQPYYEKFRQKGGSKEKRLYGLDRICKKKKYIWNMRREAPSYHPEEKISFAKCVRKILKKMKKNWANAVLRKQITKEKKSI